MFLISLLTVRVPFFHIIWFNYKRTRKQKGQKGTTGEPRRSLMVFVAGFCYGLEPFTVKRAVQCWLVHSVD